MLMLLVLIGLGFLWWWFLAPTRLFLQGFAGLLESSDYSSAKLFSFRATISGRFNGRPVGLDLNQPGENRLASLIVLMKTSAPDGSPWKDSTLVSQNPDISRATFDLEGKYALVLTLSGGWLRATASPLGVRFPGPFDPEKWRNVLQQMETVVRWLETDERRTKN
jgi:hypothetical protein